MNLTRIDHHYWTQHPDSCTLIGFAPSCASLNRFRGLRHDHQQMSVFHHGRASAVTTFASLLKQICFYQKQTSISIFFSTHFVQFNSDKLVDMSFTTISHDQWDLVSLRVNAATLKNVGAITVKLIDMSGLIMLLSQTDSAMCRATVCSRANFSLICTTM